MDPTGKSPAALAGLYFIPGFGEVLITITLATALAALVAWLICRIYHFAKKNISKVKTISKADTKIRNTVKKSSITRYWSATLKQGYVDLGKPLTYSQAVKEVSSGHDVFTVTQSEAKPVAREAGGSSGANNKPLYPEVDKGKMFTRGYYWHYHTYNRNGGRGKIMLILKNNSMNEKKYNSLIRYLCSRCDIISFLIPDYDYAVGVNYEDRIKPLMEDIEPFVLKHYISDEYCDRKTGGTYNIYNVDFNGSLIGILCSALSLYNWIYPNLPEDICFYKEGKCFLKSIAHEKQCWIYTENKKEVKDLKKLGLKFTIMPFEKAPLL